MKKPLFVSAAVGALLTAALAIPASAIGSTATLKDPDCATARTTLVKGHVAEFGADGKGGTSGALAAAKQVDRDAQEALASAQDSYAKAKVKYEAAKAADDKEDQAASARIDTPADASDTALLAAKTDRDAKAAARSEASGKAKTAQKKLSVARQAENDAAGAAVAAQLVFDKVCTPRAHDTPGAPQPNNNGIGGPTYYKDCDAARAAGAAPIHRGEPGYRFELDSDKDGIACEPVGPAEAPGANSNNSNNGVDPSIPSPSDTSQIGQAPVGPVNTGDGSRP